MEQDIGRDVAGYRRFPQGIEGRGIELIDPLGYPPGGQGAQDTDVLGLLRGVDPAASGDDGVSPGQGQEAPVWPAAQFLALGPELVGLLPGIAIDSADRIENLAGMEIGLACSGEPSSSANFPRPR
jgi:hypothetical protein